MSTDQPEQQQQQQPPPAQNPSSQQKTKLDKFETFLDIPQDIKVSLQKNMLEVVGPLGKTFKNFKKIPVNITVSPQEQKIILKAVGLRKKDYSILNTSKSTIRNLMEGVAQGYTIKMKIVFAHFPITVKTNEADRTVIIENFQGERAARISKIIGKTKVAAKGDDIIITGFVKTEVTQTAANIQLRTRVKGKDHRVFLDGIYIFEQSVGIDKGGSKKSK